MVSLNHFVGIFSIEFGAKDFSIVKLILDFVWRFILFLKSFISTCCSIYQDRTRYL